jgi:hypothetical protein
VTVRCSIGLLPKARTADHAETLVLLGRLTGSWESAMLSVDQEGDAQQPSKAWVFGWTLEGRAAQDVITISPDAEVVGPGTTVRSFNHRTGLWWLVWEDPCAGESSVLFACAEGDRVALYGPWTIGGSRRPFRWTVSEINSGPFRWECHIFQGGELGASPTRCRPSASPAVFLSRIRTAPPGRRQGTTLLRDLADGWRVFRSETWLWVDGIYSALGNCAVFAPLLALGPVVALRSLGGAGAWATITAALGVGSISAGLVLLRARPARPLFVGVILSLLALPTALLALPAPTVVIAVGALAGGFGLSVFNTLFETTVQQFVSPRRFRGSPRSTGSCRWACSRSVLP